MRNDPPGVPVPRAEWSVVAHKKGLPWWGAVLVAVGATVLGAAIDLTIGDTLTTIFQVFYGLGCVAAVLAVAQRGLFAPMVQPPLVLAVAVPSVVLLLGGPTDGSTRGRVIAAVIPLVNGFPTMAVATLLTVGLGVFRIRSRRAAPPAHTGRPRRGASSPAPRSPEPRGTEPGRGEPTRADRSHSDARGEEYRDPRPRRQRTPGATPTPAPGRSPADDAAYRRPAPDAPARDTGARRPPRPRTDDRGSAPREGRDDRSRREDARRDDGPRYDGSRHGDSPRGSARRDDDRADPRRSSTWRDSDTPPPRRPRPGSTPAPPPWQGSEPGSWRR